MGGWRCELPSPRHRPPRSSSGSRRWRISPSASSRSGLLALVLAGPAWFALLLVIPVILSALIIRYRTVADRDTVTARTLLGSQTVSWDDIDGPALRQGFVGVRATQGRQRTEAARGDVRDAAVADRGQRGPGAQPLRVGRLGQRVAAVEQHPHRDAGADAQHQRGERADERPTRPAAAGVQPVTTGADQDDRRDGADQDDFVLVAVGEERRQPGLFVGASWPPPGCRSPGTPARRRPPRA